MTMDAHSMKAQIGKLHEDSFVWALRCSHQDHDFAQDALQIVYLKILEGKAVFHAKSSFKTWLFSVIRNTVIEMRRKKQVRLRKEAAYAAQKEHLNLLTPTIDFRVFKFRQKIAKLPSRQQQVLDLYFYHDMTLADIAAVLKISVGSVRQHYDRGKRKLKILLLPELKIDNE